MQQRLPPLLLPGEMPPNFVVQELVHPVIFQSRGLLGSIGHTSQFQRNYVNYIRYLTGCPWTVNNWHTGGDRVHSGTRPPMMKPSGGGLLSQHYLANAVDGQSREFTPLQIHELLLDHWPDFWEIGLTTLEDVKHTWRPGTKGWTHADARIWDAATMIRLEKEKRFAIVQP